MQNLMNGLTAFCNHWMNSYSLESSFEYDYLTARDDVLSFRLAL